MIIYSATNILNHNIYIGATSKTLEERKCQHFYHALQYKTDTPFYRALRKYGQEKFIWNILLHCDSVDEMNQMESYFIFYYSLLGKVYNVALGGVGNKPGESHPNYRKDSDVNLDELIDLRTNGFTYKQIALQYNCSESTIIRKIKNFNTVRRIPNSGVNDPKYRKDLDEQQSKIIKLRNEGKSLRNIAKQFNCTYNIIQKRLVKWGYYVKNI